MIHALARPTESRYNASLRPFTMHICSTLENRCPKPISLPCHPPLGTTYQRVLTSPLLPFHPYNSIMPLPFPIAPAPNGAFGIPTSFGVEFASASRLPER